MFAISHEVVSTLLVEENPHITIYNASICVVNKTGGSVEDVSEILGNTLMRTVKNILRYLSGSGLILPTCCLVVVQNPHQVNLALVISRLPDESGYFNYLVPTLQCDIEYHIRLVLHQPHITEE